MTKKICDRCGAEINPGRKYNRTEQVKKCGNAVPPPLATALVRANMPEWCARKKIGMMEEFKEAMAV